MSLTFLAKSRAYSWKMSLVGQVLCQRMLIGPCALRTDGKPSVAAPAVTAAAAVRKLRRDTPFCFVSLPSSFFVIITLLSVIDEKPTV